MSTVIQTVPKDKAEQIERVLIGGDLGKLNADERVSYYRMVCESVGLNPLTRPFEYITLNGKLTLYARKDCTDQLRNVHAVSINIVARESVEGCYVVTARATLPNGRADESIGAVPVENLKGEARANSLMKCETKAKRRVTLSICGLGILDETEIETIPSARPAEQAPPAKTISFKKQDSAAGNKPQDVALAGVVQAADTTSTAERSVMFTADEAVAVAPAVSPAAVEYITVNQQKEFHAACRIGASEDPKKRNKADQQTYQWLLDNGYLNMEGQPSASAIPVKDWPKAKTMAAKWVAIQ